MMSIHPDPYNNNIMPMMEANLAMIACTFVAKTIIECICDWSSFYCFVLDELVSDEELVMQASGTNDSLVDNVMAIERNKIHEIQDEAVSAEAMKSDMQT